jgi:hypothetical protein
MNPARYWHRVHHMDPRARALADRHYSRQTPGSLEFTAPGHKVVLLHFDREGTAVALWASHRCAPSSGVVRMDGLDVWDCSIFRNEQQAIQASLLVKEAVAITKGVWQDGELPRHGFWTTVSPKKVAPVRRRGRDVWGYCFIKAGWEMHDQRTKRRGLVQLSLARDQLAAVEPVTAAWNYPAPLFGGGFTPA